MSTEHSISLTVRLLWQKVLLVFFYKWGKSGRLFSPFFELCWSLSPPAVSVLLPTPAISWGCGRAYFCWSLPCWQL